MARQYAATQETGRGGLHERRGTAQVDVATIEVWDDHPQPVVDEDILGAAGVAQPIVDVDVVGLREVVDLPTMHQIVGRARPVDQGRRSGLRSLVLVMFEQRSQGRDPDSTGEEEDSAIAASCRRQGAVGPSISTRVPGASWLNSALCFPSAFTVIRSSESVGAAERE